MIRAWRCRYSTVSFGRKVEFLGTRVFGETEEQALNQAEAIGVTAIVGAKFLGVTPEN